MGKFSLASNDYRRIAHLVTHQETRSMTSFFQLSFMTRFILRCLDKADYFKRSDNVEKSKLLVGSLLLHTLQLLQFNCHEVSELQVKSLASLPSYNNSNNYGNEQSVGIGAALYPTLAFFNHSCDPSVVRYCNHIFHLTN